MQKICVCHQVVLCVFSQEQIGRGQVYIEYTPKVLQVLLLITPKKYCVGKMRIHYFSGHFFSPMTPGFEPARRQGGDGAGSG